MKHLLKTKWRTWSAAKKGMIVGGITAALVTICMEGVLLKTQFANDPEGKSLNFWIGILAMPIEKPTIILLEILKCCFGWTTHGGLTAGIVCLTVAVNSFVGATIGFVIACSKQIVELVFRQKK